MKTIYFIRHAESEGNAQGILTGHLDLPLTPAGEAAAYGASKRWELIKPEIVYCSALQRTQQTAQLLFPKAEVLTDDRLNERDYGDWSGRLKSELRRLHPDFFFQDGKVNPEYNAPSGERLDDFLARLKTFLARLASSPEETAVCVTHRGLLAALMGRAPYNLGKRQGSWNLPSLCFVRARLSYCKPPFVKHNNRYIYTSANSLHNSTEHTSRRQWWVLGEPIRPSL